MDKHWTEELMEQFDNWEDLVKDQIKEKLWNYENQEEYGCDLAYKLFEGENVDGSFTYSTYWSIELIRKYWDDFADIYQNFVDSTGSTLNPFNSAEGFVVVMLLEEAQNILSNLDIINEYWNDKIVLNKKNINKIIKELEA